MQRGKCPMMVPFCIQRPIDMVVLGSDKGFPIKASPIFRLLSSTKIGCLTLSLKEEMVVEMGLRFLHAKRVCYLVFCDAIFGYEV
ncbi:hypothetical protein MTR67_040016 [Solanum verrucosum]|uniref:Uncharacterized protein n=1 Tax=Solanum verrucosum TaxID=315347 RepID=A0AAF0UJM3_SOLVR|nr:hypothetical protein MTR67_040016 [Solanum verrucosum]